MSADCSVSVRLGRRDLGCFGAEVAAGLGEEEFASAVTWVDPSAVKWEMTAPRCRSVSSWFLQGRHRCRSRSLCLAYVASLSVRVAAALAVVLVSVAQNRNLAVKPRLGCQAMPHRVAVLAPLLCPLFHLC